MSSNFQLVKQAQFNGIEFDCYRDNEAQGVSNDFWATREQIGRVLGYENPRDAIYRIHERHKERLDKFSGVDVLSTPGGKQEVIIYNFKGLLEICRHSDQPKADAVMDFLWEIADEIRLKGSYTVHGSGLSDKEIDLERVKALQNLLDKHGEIFDEAEKHRIACNIIKIITGKELANKHSPDKVRHKFLCRFKQLRKAMNLTQEDLAEILGVHRNTIVRWETGMKVPNEYRLQELSEVFDCTVSEVLASLPARKENY